MNLTGKGLETVEHYGQSNEVSDMDGRKKPVWQKPSLKGLLG